MMDTMMLTCADVERVREQGCFCDVSDTRGRFTIATQKMGCPVHDVLAVEESEPETVRDLADDVSASLDTSGFAPFPEPLNATVAEVDAGTETFGLFALAMPKADKVLLSASFGSFEIPIGVARRLTRVIGDALKILEGAHSVQGAGQPAKIIGKVGHHAV